MSEKDLSKAISKTLESLDTVLNGTGKQGPRTGIINKDLVNGKIVVQHRPRSAECEYFRFLQSRIVRYFNENSPKKSNIKGGKDGKVILITGATRGVGKTVCAINLALAFARSYGNQTLFLDADSRNRTVESYLGISEESYPEGITDVLSMSTRAGSVLINTGMSNLIYFPSGDFREDFVDQLKGSDLELLLANLRKRFKFIIIDTPPVFPMPETTALATQSDGVLMVMGAGKDGKNELDMVVDALKGTNVIGAVLNKIDLTPVSKYGSYGGYY